MKKELEISLGIQWNGSDIENITTITENFLQALDNSFYKRDLPIHWLLPCAPFLESKNQELNNLILEIKTRIKSLKDTPVATGYAGASFPLLTNEELEKELSWTITNPWKSGIQDIFGVNPEILIPAITLLFEKETIDFYRDKGFKYLGVNNVFPPVYSNTLNSIIPFYYLELTALPLVADLKKKVKFFLREKYHYLLFIIEINSNTTTGSIKSLWQNFIKIVDWLAKQYAISFLTINNSRNIKQTPFCKQLTNLISLHNSLSIRQQLLAADQYKMQNGKKNENYKNILVQLNSSGEYETKIFNQDKKIQHNFPPADRISDCTMQGNTILAGVDFAGNFINGKLYNLEDNNGRNLLAGEVSKSYITISNKEYLFHNLSSFSVGGEYTRGLRESLKIELPGNIHEGFQITEYIFIDNFPYLIVTSKIKYPALDIKTIIDVIAPFEIPLFFMEGAIKILAISPGKQQTYTLDPVHSLYTIPANLVSIPIRDTNLVFGFPPEKNSSQGVIELKIRQCKKQYLLVINLFGTYTPVKAQFYNRITEIFSFYIGVCPVIPEKIPYFPAKILKEIPEQIILNDSGREQ